MSAQGTSGPGPLEGLPDTFGDIHNWTELLHFLNHTLPGCTPELSEDAKRVALFILYLAIFVVGLVENLLVIGVSWRGAGRAGPPGLYILHMAAADLALVLSLPVWMLEVTLDYTWLWGSFFCRFAHYLYFASMYSSVFFLVCLSVERYLGLARAAPSGPRQRRPPHGRRHCLLLGAYVAAFAACWLPFHVTQLLLTLEGPHISLHCYLAHLLYFFYDVIDCFSMLHCVINPVLYNFLSRGFQGRLQSAVVHYLPRARARAGARASSTSSSTQHSILITKEGGPPPAAAAPLQHSGSGLQAPPLPAS
ncbi:PREDICTED: G-protein coupled receptor 182 [Condylura cristata]|uniref:G-protein coupled receptor 182 n=1 Tax=Condylura cristata TaxID=143302 RepID=UPI00033479A9|nr:PREDICTED: G-protein coupled receptor 182 [Condylura cristata]